VGNYSKEGQDLWVLEQKKDKKGYFVDIGAYDGVETSNTKKLEESGWEGICIEGNKEMFEKLKISRSCKCVNEVVWEKKERVEFIINGFGSGVTAEKSRWNDYRKNKIKNLNYEEREGKALKDIFIENNVPKKIDYMSVDIEGSEEYIFSKELFEEYEIDLITIEVYNNSLDKDENYKSEVINFLLNIGYKLDKNPQGAESCEYFLKRE